MCYPGDQEQSVFYNPVQVQNRDLSILMITLYAERRAKRLLANRYRKQLRQQQQQKQQTPASPTKSRTTEINETPCVLEGFNLSFSGKQALEQLPQEDGLTIIEALAASGLRSVRYWKEIPGVRHVTINDLEEAAVERAQLNIELNNLTNEMVTDELDPLTKLRPNGIRINHGDAMDELYRSRRSSKISINDPINARKMPRWDVVDLDPYGSAVPFLDGAVQAVENGGLLCITCTDMAALGGSHPETCFGRYAGMPIPQSGYLHELALRILLQAVASSAARYGRTIKPILSVGMDFYIRVFCEVYDDKAGVNDFSLKLGYVYQSTVCPSFHIQSAGKKGGKKGAVYQPGRIPVLSSSENAWKVAGPIWLGPLHDKDVLQEALRKLEEDPGYPAMKWIATRTRLQGLLTVASEEIETPLYYHMPDLAKVLHIAVPPMNQMKAALLNAGFRVSGFHKDPQAIKTDAPGDVVWDILRRWSQLNPPSKPPLEGSVAEKIFSAPINTTIDFTIPSGMARKTDVARFPGNPERNWGPKAKAIGNKRKAETSSKR